MVPNFIIIGGMKCGTSSLHYYLSLHPEIGMSAIKETDYFIEENNYNKGFDWYKSQFQGSFRIFGEASPNYTKAHYFSGVPQRMHQALPDIQLIYLVRDPIVRIISHFTHNVAAGREQQSIDEALSDLSDNHYVMCSRYYWQLNHFLSFFDKDQILIVNSDRLMHQRKETLQSIFKFLAVDANFYTAAFEQQQHKTTTKRKKGKLSKLVLDQPVIRSLKKAIPDRLKNPIKQATRTKVEKPKLSQNRKEILCEALQPDVEQLRDFTGQPFDTWSV